MITHLMRLETSGRRLSGNLINPFPSPAPSHPGRGISLSESLSALFKVSGGRKLLSLSRFQLSLCFAPFVWSKIPDHQQGARCKAPRSDDRVV